jgi:hypothetical protein
MLNLTNAIDKATGYVYVPPPETKLPPDVINQMDTAPDLRSNEYGLFSTAAGPRKGPLSDIRDVQERWIDEREAYDVFENRRWRDEGEALRNERVTIEQARSQEEKSNVHD